MSASFVIPDWLPRAPFTPPEPLDEHRVEGLVNQFIAGKQEALFVAPDAFYRLEGADAVDGRQIIEKRLQALREAILDQARDADERTALGSRLDLHIDDANDGIDRHVATQQREHRRQIISERQRLILRAAELEPDNDDKLAGLADAHASAADALARLNGEPEGTVIDKARSAFWRAAIDQRLGNGHGSQALALFDRVTGQLDPTDRLSLETPLQAARNDQIADQWIARESAAEGAPLQDRIAADPDMPSDVKFIVRAKVDARDSAEESARVARVLALDDEFRDALRILPTEAYRPGTFARLADGYASAGSLSKAADVRRLGLQEPFLLAFTQVSPDRQQRLIDGLPDQGRSAAEAVQSKQAEAVASNVFGTEPDLNAHGGSASFAGNADDYTETERMLDALDATDRSTDAEQADLLHPVGVRENERQGKAAEDAEVARIRAIDPDAKIVRQVRIYIAGGPDYMVADIIFKGSGIAVINITEVKSGSGGLTDKQSKALAEAVRTGRVYITNAEAAAKLEIRSNITFGEQKIIPEVYVTGGDSAKMERQLRNQGVDVRPRGVRGGRLRIGGPPI